MTSILTNSGALAALQTLRSINDQMNQSQNRISSGLRVGSAADNAAYWSIATTMRADNAALGTVSDALGLAAAKVDTAYAGLSTSIDIMSQINTKLTAAKEPGADKDKINREITELKNQISTVARSSAFSGENWLYNTSTAAPGTKSMVGSFVRDSTGATTIQTIDFDTATSTLIDTKTASRGLLTKATTVTVPTGATTTTGTFYLISAATGATGTQVNITSSTSNIQLDMMIAAVDSMMKSMTDSAATLGAASNRVTTQSNFVKTLQETIQKGIGRLVDADMNEESTKLKALQTQQQLGIQALSIANSNSENILQLFR
jgi:flagellin